MQKNLAQEELIHTIDGQVIVIACPGAGKTTTLVRRIHHMVDDCGIDSDNILMITFTAAAAKEMKERYEKMYGKDQVTFCTIHSLCLAIVRKYLGITNESILSDSSDFFFEQLKKNRKINDKMEFIKLLQTDISVVKNNSIPLFEYQPQCCDDQDLFESLFHAYEDYKERLNLIDFDDMLIKAYECMKNNEECLKWLRNKYQYIQVDEYQDVNFLQRDIIYLLAGEFGNLAVVGDDDQSIYGFRGARPEVMLKFKDYYKDAKVIHMNTNYRSCFGIINAADDLIKDNQVRFEKEFNPFVKEKGQIEVIHSKSRQEELLSVVLKIEDLLKQGVEPSDIAILYRTNKQAEGIASMLMSKRIDFVSNEKIPNRYQHWMFKDIQSFQKLTNGQKWTKQDLSRVLNHPQRFLFDYGYIQAGLDRKKMIMNAKAMHVDSAWKARSTIENISEFFNVLSHLKDKKPLKFLNILELYGRYLEYLHEYADFRNEDYEELFDIWSKYKEDAKNHDDWTDWGRYIIGYQKAMNETLKTQTGVTLSTMHCSKGLEWKYVFIIDCVDGVYPFTKAKSLDAVEEERRLFYVAMTRAKEYLYFCTYDQKGKKVMQPSPFLKRGGK